MTKILYSPGFGAGWTSWAPQCNSEVIKFMLTYSPFIEALEGGKKILEPKMYRNDADIKKHGDYDLSGNPLVTRFVEDFVAKFPTQDIPYLGAVGDLAIYEVSGPFRIEEYDGSESVIETYDDWIVL